MYIYLTFTTKCMCIYIWHLLQNVCVHVFDIYYKMYVYMYLIFATKCMCTCIWHLLQNVCVHVFNIYYKMHVYMYLTFTSFCSKCQIYVHIIRQTWTPLISSTTFTPNILSTLNVINYGFKSWSGQTKNYKIGICCFSAIKHTVLRRKNKDWLARY
jgi:hypothetical protein